MNGNRPWPIDICRLSWLSNFIITLFKSLGRRRFCSEGDNVLTSNDHKTQTSFDLFLNSGFASLSDSVFLSIGEYDIHVFIEGEEGAHHHAAILDGDPYSEVNPL